MNGTARQAGEAIARQAFQQFAGDDGVITASDLTVLLEQIPGLEEEHIEEVIQSVGDGDDDIDEDKVTRMTMAPTVHRRGSRKASEAAPAKSMNGVASMS